MPSQLLRLSLVCLSFAVHAADLPPGHPPINSNHSVQAEVPLAQKATVVDIINVPQYTYLEVSQNNQSRWIAAPTITVKKDDVVEFDNGMIMENFHSKTLDRTFPSIAFVNRVVLSKK